MFPSNYTPPVASEASGNYTKIKDDPVKLRILSEAVTGYVYWTNDNKPVRMMVYPQSTPNIREDSKPKHFWAFKVWNYTTQQVEVWEISQASIRDALWAYWEDKEDYGDLRNFPIKVSKTGKGLDTKYSVIAGKARELESEIEQISANTPVNLFALFDGGNPFKPNENELASTQSTSFDEDF